MPAVVFQMALRKLGYSGNTTDPKEIEAAYNELKADANVAAFNSDNPANPYMEGEVNLGMIWNGLLLLHAAGTPIDVVAEERRYFLDGQAAIPANAKKQRRRTEIDQLPAAPGWQNRLLKLSVIQRQTLRRVSC